jgi:phosphoribosylformylglycinamidine synthase subunit PurS
LAVQARRRFLRVSADKIAVMARVVVDVMPKPEILDPQGKAVTGALARLGFAGISVRQGKRFELEVDGELTAERLADVHHAAETLLANPVIETFQVRVESAEPAGDQVRVESAEPAGDQARVQAEEPANDQVRVDEPEAAPAGAR